MLPIAAGAVGAWVGYLLGDATFRSMAERGAVAPDDQAGHAMMMILGTVVIAAALNRAVEHPVRWCESRLAEEDV